MKRVTGAPRPFPAHATFSERCSLRWLTPEGGRGQSGDRNQNTCHVIKGYTKLPQRKSSLTSYLALKTTRVQSKFKRSFQSIHMCISKHQIRGYWVWSLSSAESAAHFCSARWRSYHSNSSKYRRRTKTSASAP